MDNTNSINKILSIRVWIFLIFSSFIALTYQQSYCTSVCPFIEGLSPDQFLKTLTYVTIFHIIVRYLLFFLFSKSWSNYSIYRQAYLLSVASWIIAGAFALALHFVWYPSFPMASHLKLMSGYWFIGGGILAQLEYLIFEMSYKKAAAEDNESMVLYETRESLSRRILEGYLIFAIVPTATMILIISRYYYEKVLSGHLFGEVLYISFTTILASVVTAVLIGRLLHNDSKDIVDTLSKIENGDLESNVHITRNDELGQISNSINNMTKGLRHRKSLKSALDKFVDPEVAKKFIENNKDGESLVKLGGETKKVVVLMCDIRNFTPMSEKLHPDKVVELLNEHFSIMVQTIISHNGMIDKYIGDAIMAIFGVNDPENKEEYALKASKEMIENLSILNKNLAKKDLPPIKIGIGLHTGSVTAGFLGTQDRLEYTVIGATVNTSARIEAQTKAPNPPLLFSEEFNNKVKDNFSTSLAVTTNLKGISQVMDLYSLDEFISKS